MQSSYVDHANAKLLFKRVKKAVHQKLLTVISGASVWSLTKNKEVSWSIDGKSFCRKFDAVILTMPVPQIVNLHGMNSILSNNLKNK